MSDFFESEDFQKPVRNTDRWATHELEDSLLFDPRHAAHRSIEYIKQEGVVWRSVIHWAVGVTFVDPNTKFSWITDGYLVQLERQLIDEIDRSRPTFADPLDEFLEEIELINPQFREDLNKALVDVRAIRSVLSKWGKMPDDSLHDLNLLVAQADDITELYQIRSRLQAYDEMGRWGELGSDRWGMIVELYNNEELDLFRHWGRQEWLDIEKILDNVNRSIDKKMGHGINEAVSS